MSKLAFRAQTVDIACLPLRQDLFAKNVLMTAQRDFGLGNSLMSFDHGSRVALMVSENGLRDLGKDSTC
jgi:hypothetical protein